MSDDFQNPQLSLVRKVRALSIIREVLFMEKFLQIKQLGGASRGPDAERAKVYTFTEV